MELEGLKDLAAVVCSVSFLTVVLYHPLAENMEQFLLKVLTQGLNKLSSTPESSPTVSGFITFETINLIVPGMEGVVVELKVNSIGITKRAGLGGTTSGSPK